jgi:CDGSH-type Zn-finger protein
MRIKIVQNGPYIVTGGIPIKEMIITPQGHQNVLVEGRELSQSEEYCLCRCGHSSNPPFCNGVHKQIGFVGKETASKAPYNKRIKEVVKGGTMMLLDDNRCAFARFCHRNGGSIWELIDQDRDPKMRAEAIQAANECPSGRLVAVMLNGEPLEAENEPEIIILQDPSQGTSAGIFVKGPIIVESADGTEYEVRNRVALCRCGESCNKPFCDASHIDAKYVEKE